jgi:cytochrome c
MRDSVRLSAIVVAIAAVGCIAGQAAGGATGGESAVYTETQALNGRQVYYRNCANCHGENLEGKVGPPLTGRQFHQMVASQKMTAPMLLQFISTQMPQAKPGSLTAEQYADVMAFILAQNGYPAGNVALTANSPGLKDINLAAPGASGAKQ